MKKIISANLTALAEEKTKSDSALTIPKQAEAIGIPYPTFMKYLKGTIECSAANVAKMADYYNVSADYIMGRTRSKTLEKDLQNLAVQLDLSDEAVQQLLTPWIYHGVQTVMKYEDQFESIQSIIDSFLSHNMPFIIAKDVDEEQDLFNEYIRELKQIEVNFDNKRNSVMKAYSLINGWKHDIDTMNYKLSLLLPEFKKEYMQSLYIIREQLDEKICKILTASGEEAQKESIDEYNKYLSAL
ncbi:MAG: helix-turn-helix transcriptional regulator [Clostridia bacterium]|nr:helix-turn-helix transcriptional regulator [Clostridia bacterium]